MNSVQFNIQTNYIKIHKKVKKNNFTDAACEQRVKTY